MKLSDVPKFDPSVFTSAERQTFQTLTDQCVTAKSRPDVNVAGEKLARARQAQREKTRKNAARARSLNALHKRLIREVPRPPEKAPA